MTRGAVRSGTVGVMGSGRLVLVLSVENTRATLVELPDQPRDISNILDFYSQIIQGQKGFITSPFVDLEVVDPETLSDINKKFIETGIAPPPRPRYSRPLKVSTRGGSGDRKLCVVNDSYVVAKYPQYEEHLRTVFTIVRDKEQPTHDEVIEEGKRRGLWTGKLGQTKAIHWCINQLVKVGCLRWI